MRRIVAGSFTEDVEIAYKGEWAEDNVLKTRVRVHWGYELTSTALGDILCGQWVQVFLLRNGKWFLYPYQVKIPSDKLYAQRDRAYEVMNQSIQRRLLRMKRRFFSPSKFGETKPRGVHHLAATYRPH